MKRITALVLTIFTLLITTSCASSSRPANLTESLSDKTLQSGFEQQTRSSGHLTDSEIDRFNSRVGRNTVYGKTLVAYCDSAAHSTVEYFLYIYSKENTVHRYKYTFYGDKAAFEKGYKDHYDMSSSSVSRDDDYLLVIHDFGVFDVTPNLSYDTVLAELQADESITIVE